MITDYNALQAALATYAIRTDQTANWPVNIAMGESRLNRLLSCRQMVTALSDSVTGATDALPADFNGMKALRLASGTYPKLEPVSVDGMDELKARPDVSGEPTHYAITGLNIEFYPEPATATPYKGYYYAQIPPLSDTPTNWLLTAYPDAYLYASLIHYGIMVGDDRLGAWSQALDTIVSEISQNDIASVYGDRLTPQLNSTIA